MIEREVVRRDFFHAARDEQCVAALLGIARRIADHPEPSLAMPPPMEDLAAAECQPEIKFRRGNLRERAAHFTK